MYICTTQQTLFSIITNNMNITIRFRESSIHRTDMAPVC